MRGELRNQRVKLGQQGDTSWSLAAMVVQCGFCGRLLVYLLFQIYLC